MNHYVYLSLPLVQAFCCTVLAAIVWRGRYPNRLFSFFLICLGLWGVIVFGMRSSSNLEEAYIWDRLVIPLSPLMSTLFFHFSVQYTGSKINKYVIPGLYVLCVLQIPLAITGLIFSGMQLKPYGYAPVFGPVWPVWILIMYGLTIMTLVNFILARKSTTVPEQRNRLTYIVLAIIISLVGGIFDALPVLGLPLYPGAIIATIIFCVLTTIAIVKYQLLDIRLVIRKSIMYILTSAAMALPVILTFFVATYLLSESPLAIWLYLLLVIILAFFLPALWKVIQRQVDRWFFRDRYVYLKALESFGWHSQSLSDISEVNETTVRMLAGALGASNVYLLYPLAKSGDFQVVCDAKWSGKDTGLVIKKQSPLLLWLEHSNRLLRVSDISIVPQLQNVVIKEQALMESIGVDMVVPLQIRGGKLSGLLLLGKKLDHQPYDIEDIQQLATLSNPIAITLENMRLYRDILESRENLETWLNSMSDPVIIVDDKRAVQFMNQAATRSFEDNPGDKCWQFLGRVSMCLDCPIFEASDDADRHSPRRIGTRIIGNAEYEVATAPLLNPDGSHSIIEVFRDVTERKRLEKEIIQAQVKIEALKQSERMKNDLLSMVSHELRTPLAVIKGQITSLLRRSGRWKDSEKIDSLRDIDQATDSLSRLVANLLDMSILEAGTIKLEKDYYQVSEILEWANRSLKVATVDHILEIKLPPELPAVFVDRTRIGQVLFNLCENAAKYSDRGSHIFIEAKAKDNEVLVGVVDEGQGIRLEYQEKVFEKFFRVSNNNSSGMGVGLGLAICRGIVEAHGGQIYVESASGKGSKFIFSLPVNGN